MRLTAIASLPSISVNCRKTLFRTAELTVHNDAPKATPVVPQARRINSMPLVELRRDGTIAVVVIDNPPVNALKNELRAGLIDAFANVRGDANIHAIVLACAGRTFIAGADITEFGKPSRPPSTIDVVAALDAMPKPVVAALHGTALGGGLEIALGCHFRVAAPGTRLGLPEIKLGLIPGAGGTQRLPRLIGMAKALPMISQRRSDRCQSSTRTRIGRCHCQLRCNHRSHRIRPQACFQQNTAAPRARH